MSRPKVNPRSLKVIKTGRTEKAINKAAKAGFFPLVKKVIPSKEIHDMLAVFQDPETGEIEVSGDMRWRPDGEMVIDYTYFYQYHFPSPFAAYLIPKNLEEGEVVWLDDIIEDIVAVYGNQGYNSRLEKGEATWENGDFKIHFNPETDADVLIG